MTPGKKTPTSHVKVDGNLCNNRIKTEKKKSQTSVVVYNQHSQWTVKCPD